MDTHASRARDETRAADADRAVVADRLRAAVDEGRLELGEYDERLRAAYAAVTYAELDRVTADLPAASPAAAPAQPEERAAARAEWVEEWRSWLGGAVIMIGIWLATSLASGGFHGFWPAIPLGIWAAVLLASAVGGAGGRKTKCGGRRR